MGCRASFTSSDADNDNCHRLATFTPHIKDIVSVTSELPYVTEVQANNKGFTDGYATHGDQDSDFHSEFCHHGGRATPVNAIAETVRDFDC